ncbi:MAG TPA: adaptor protein MecA [Clostridiaceae bacterium]|nr:adaptor protein MecA [Clostridiaceae bacterium]
MKIEKISENIIKVTISLDDLEERNIDISSLNYNSPAAQNLFWDMVEQAEEQLGLNISDSQLLIEPYQDFNDGFTITITKISDDADFESIQKYIKSRFKKSDLRVRRKIRKLSSSLIIYAFENFEDLCMLCKNIQPLYNGKSSLYELNNVYYLTLIKPCLGQSNSGLFESLLNEYGTKIQNTNFYEGYLNEYGIKIIEENGIQTINKYF